MNRRTNAIVLFLFFVAGAAVTYVIGRGLSMAALQVIMIICLVMVVGLVIIARHPE